MSSHAPASQQTVSQQPERPAGSLDVAGVCGHVLVLFSKGSPAARAISKQGVLAGVNNQSGPPDVGSASSAASPTHAPRRLQALQMPGSACCNAAGPGQLRHDRSPALPSPRPHLALAAPGQAWSTVKALCVCPLQASVTDTVYARVKRLTPVLRGVRALLPSAMVDCVFDRLQRNLQQLDT